MLVLLACMFTLNLTQRKNKKANQIETEPKKDAPPAKSLEEVVEKHKELGSEVYKNTVAIEAVHRLSGIRVFYIGDKSPKGSKGEICVAAIYSGKLKQIADAMATKDLSLMPETAPGEPVDSFIPDKNTNEGRLALVNKMGVDVRADDQGNFWLISYGQAGPDKEGSKMSRNRARRLAQVRALGALRAYIAENFVSFGMGDVEEVSIEYEGDVPDADTLVENVTSTAKSIMEKMDIEGAAIEVINQILDTKIFPTQVVAEFEVTENDNLTTEELMKYDVFKNKLISLINRMKKLNYSCYNNPRVIKPYAAIEILFKKNS